MRRSAQTLGTIVATVGMLVATSGATPARQPPPRPLAEHPGNVFLAGEPAFLNLSDQLEGLWELRDAEGRVARQGQGPMTALPISNLAVGYYEFHRPSPGADDPIALAVLAPLRRPTPTDSPLGVDTSMAWFYTEDQQPSVASLCALAGMNWARDRFDWAATEPQAGKPISAEHYDRSVHAETAARLKVLQVNHTTPAWAGTDGHRFPLDLRETFYFHRRLAAHWRGEVLAFEPWNEPDLETFGNHTAGEIASFQKAAYWGVKAGNPRAIVCLAPLVYRRPHRLEEFRANEVWPYFDTFNFHHYVPTDRYPKLYADFRSASGGRPVWVTEACLPMEWAGDAGRQEPESPRGQAERVGRLLASALHEGPALVNYFCLPHYAEGTTQYGLLRRDLTPRPAYVALAAAGRLLAAARPLGRQNSEATNVHAYWFRARPDGRRRDVLVCWSEGEGRLSLPKPPIEAFDYLGREETARGQTTKLSPSPQYLVFPRGTASKVRPEPPPAAAPFLREKPCPLVLQAVWPPARTLPDGFGYRVEREESIPLFLYHFGNRAARGTVRVTAPWPTPLTTELTIHPEERIPLWLSLRNLPFRASDTNRLVELEGDFGPLGRTRLAFRVSIIDAARTGTSP